MSVSVVIPTKDRLSSLRRVLPTYLSQPEVEEIIVVVDGSTDGTITYLRDLASADSKIRYIDNGVNRGIPYSKNAGIDIARSDFIFIGEDDVELTDGFIRTLLDHAKACGADVICGRTIWRYEHETSKAAIARTDSIPGPAVNLRTIEIKMGMKLAGDTTQLLLAGTMLATAEVFRRIRYDERYKVNFWREETDFQFSAQEFGYKLVSCPHAICFNYMIENDRGGVYARIGWRRLLWVSINNWRFLKKHRDFISRNFSVGNHVVFEVLTTGRVFREEMLYPFLVRAKRWLRQTAHAVSTRPQSQTSAVRVLVTPRADNPYQRLLYGGMSREEAVIRYIDGPTGSQSVNLLLAPAVLAWHRLGGYKLLHIHWVFKFQLPWARGAPAARMAMQWWFVLYLRSAHLLGYRIVWTAHDIVPHSQVFYDDERALEILLDHADVVIALSAATAARLAELGAKDVRIIPFGPYMAPSSARPERDDARRRLGIAADSFLVVSTGRVEPYKGVVELLRAVARLPEGSPVQVLVAGACQDDGYRELVVRAAGDAAERAIIRLEWVPDDEFATILCAADFAAVAFVEVTNSSSVLTSLAFGVPVIVPDLASLSDVPERCVLRYAPEADGLLKALERAAGLLPEQRSAMAEAALAYANALDWPAVASATRDLYAELLGRS